MPDSIYGEEDEQVNDSDEGESNDVVPQQPDLIYNGTSDEHFYSGNLSLTKLHLIIESVFLPLLDGSSFEASESGMPKEGGLQLGLNIDFMTHMKKFNVQLSHMIKQLSGEVTLDIPDVYIEDVQSAAHDEQLVRKLETSLSVWTQAIRSLVEIVNNKERDGDGPLSEIEYWRTRHALLGTIWEQLNDANVKKMISVLRACDAQMLPGYDDQFQELTKLYMEAKDNVKFLQTLERHFKNISKARGTLLPILDTLSSMMNAIRMVWVISRHYNTDKRMNPLMELIANEITSKVASYINIRQSIKLMYDNPEELKNKLYESSDVCAKWKSTYLAVRERIEQAKRDERWDFDKDKLFEKSDYMIEKCSELIEICDVVAHYKSFLGPELRSVTGDTRGIDNILNRVRNLLVPIQQVTYDMFDKKASKLWADVMKVFKEQVQDINKRTISFIDKSFKKLRSAEGAFRLLQDVKSISTQETNSTTTLSQKMMLKSIDILDRYSEEIDHLNMIFQMEKASPPKTKNLPPTAGAIYWADSLFQRIKKPMLQFQKAQDILNSENGKKIKDKCFQVARAIKDYEEKLFSEWEATISADTVRYLKSTILARHPQKQTSYVNFNPELLLLMQETKYLDKLGKKVPEIALNVTLQEEKYHGYIEDLKIMLDNFDSAVNTLESAELKVLQPQIKKVRKTLEPGYDVLNWNSLGIDEFIKRCNSQINEFHSIVKKVQKNAGIIGALVNQIRHASLVKEPQLKAGELMSLQQLYKFIDDTKNDQIANLAKKYKTIGQTLLKIEGDLISSNVIVDAKDVPGREPLLKSYYSHWETLIFKALVQLIMNSLKTMQSFLGIRKKSSRRKTDVLFKVVVSLIHTAIVISPDLDDITKMVEKIIDNILDGAKNFVRWMNGTCHEVSNVQIKSDDIKDQDRDMATIIADNFSFYKDICNTTKVVKMVEATSNGCAKTLVMVQKSVNRYLKFEAYWKLPKDMAIEKFGTKNPSWEEFDEKLEEYSKLIKDIQTHSKQERDIDFIRVDCRPLLESIQSEARKWIAALGKLLNDTIRPKLNKLNDDIKLLQEEIHLEIVTIDDLQKVLKTIDDARSRSVDIERAYREIEDCYSTLRTYNIAVTEDEVILAETLAHKWNELLHEAKVIDKSLVPQKKIFTEETVTRVETFKEDIKGLRDLFNSGAGNPHVELEDGLVKMGELDLRLKELQQNRDNLVISEKLFDLPITSYPELVELENEVASIGKIYNVYAEWQQNVKKWSKTLWAEIQLEEMTKQAQKYAVMLIDKKEFPSNLQSLPIHATVKSTVYSFKDSIPLFTHLKSDALRDRHWKELMDTTGVNFDMNPATFTLKNLIDMNLYRYAEQIAEISSGAKKQLKIEMLIKGIAENWRNRKFELKKHTRDNKDRGYILIMIDEIKEKLEEDTTSLGSIAGSQYVIPFLEEMAKWEKRLSTIDEMTNLWMDVQRQWMYLEIIFIGSDDIRDQLPAQAKAFDKIDEDWAKIMNETAKNKNVLEACHYEGRGSMLQSIQARLQECQKGLSNYLQTKRNAFPRFFFISDDELLSILGSSNPRSVQEHMSKMFDNCEELTFKGNTNVIIGMQSLEGESFTYNSPITAERIVEKWLNAVEAEMRKTLKSKMKQAVFHYPKKSRIKWIKEVLGMNGLAGSQIWWTWEVEDAFRRVKKNEKMAVKELATKLTQQLNDLVDEVRRPLDKLSRKKVTTSIIIDVHARDIVDRLVRDSVLDEREFDWESQLRFYWDKSVDDVRIRQCTGEFVYGYEYMGLNGRLVITPLTDRCFMTLTQALTFHLGGSPSGPAGTGKTESVKDLAKSLAIMCVVFNCGEGLDYQAMRNIFSGLCQAGAWGCFDEFNRIELPVLSVVSTQIRTIQDALVDPTRTKFTFEEQEIALDHKTGIFITMNPGYAGRVELPDNLKTLFRPCVMVVPDMEIICEIMLLSEGFNTARALARKMTKLYSLAAGQLSKQDHYDWGLRALKAVLMMAGRLKRQDTEKNEEEQLYRALHDMNAPKFVFEDTPLFEDLLHDLFVGVNFEKMTYPSLQVKIIEDLKANNYQLLEDGNQVNKIIELYQTLDTRHSVMVVGGTCGGKSVVIQTLINAQTALKLPTRAYTLNPKAQTVSELYGVLDKDSRDWTDGTINKKSEKGEERRYILFDGDVDAVWIENMNSVMDDNKILTLPNSERITLITPQCSLLFEVGDLSYASPATVSRCGMVYVDPKNLGYEPYIGRWLETSVKVEKRPALEKYFEKYVQKCIMYLLKGQETDGTIDSSRKLKTCVPQTDMNMAAQLCTILESMFCDPEKDTNDERELECLFIFALIWSVGGSVIDLDRKKFDEFVKKISRWNAVDNGEKLNEKVITAGNYPSRLTLYEYFYDTKAHQWKPWKAIVPNYIKPADGKFSSIMVPTIDTVRYTWLLNSITAIKRPVLFVGNSGTAKTVMIQNHLKELTAKNPEGVASVFLNFSSRTSSLDVQRTIEDLIEKKIGDVYGPLNNKQLNLFIDDLNMPIVDTYGTQQPIALLKLLFEKGGFYERGQKTLDFKNIRDLQFVAAMVPPGAGRNPVDPRFISKFSVINISFPSEDSLRSIYESILTVHLEPFGESFQQLGKVLTDVTLKMYNRIVIKLPPTPSKFHYVFNLRDLSRVYEGLCLSTTDKFKNQESFVRLWRNECMRVFHDRLITDVDKNFVIDLTRELIGKYLPTFTDYAMANPLVFGDFLDMHEGESLRLYEDMVDYKKIKDVVEDTLKLYNESCEMGKSMNLVLFEDALEHLTRIHRIIRMNRGHALLVGVGGSGKQSLTRLAAFTAGFDVFEIALSRGYGEKEFKEDLQRLYQQLGVANKKTVFLFTDGHVVVEGFLEFINNMLTSGMVPALFSEEDKEPLIQAVTAEVKERDMMPSKENCWNYFVNKCRDNLHVVLAMSPAGDRLRVRCRNFPGLVNNTSIDWFTPWPAQALQEVAIKFLAAENFPPDLNQQIVDHMVNVHLSVGDFSKQFLEQYRRHTYVTPKNYLDYISTYRRLLFENRDNIDELKKRLEGGLSKLRSGKDEVEAMRKELSVAKDIVQRKTKANNILLAEISTKLAEANVQSKAAKEAEEQLSVEYEKISKEKEEAEEELKKAQPKLDEAELALSDIKKEAIQEIKSFTKPHPAVEKVGSCIVILLTEDREPGEPQWAKARAVMSDTNFLPQILKYDKKRITSGKMQRINQIFANFKNNKDFGGEELTVDLVKQKSSAAGVLLVWVEAIRLYYKVFKSVEPKRKNVEQAEKKLSDSKEELANIKIQLSTLEREIAQSKIDLDKGETEARELRENAASMERKLNSANKLIDGLGSERIRWEKQVSELEAQRVKLLGDCLLCGAFVSYCGPFTYDFRNNMVYNRWLQDVIAKQIPMSDPFKVDNILTNDVQISQWAAEGLPSDEISIQNGILTSYASRFPLCIDPQLQAVTWIKNKEKDLVIGSLADLDIKALENAARFGKPFLFENVDEYIDPMIDSILSLNPRGKNRIVKMGDEELEVDDNFRLYLCSRLSNPHYSPEIAGKTMIINYTVTEIGLTEQLLNAVVNHDRPELEQARVQLVQTMSDNKTLLQKLEEKILLELNLSAEGTLIENQELIKTLEETKIKVIDINSKLTQAATNKIENNKARDAYRIVGKRGSILYFVMASLSNINSMYEYSLMSYSKDVFEVSLERSEPSKMIDGRLENIIEYLTRAAYNYTCAGLFEQNKLTFAFQLTLKIMEGEKKNEPEAKYVAFLQEIDFILKGNISLSKMDRDNPFPSWITEQGWKDLCKLQTMDPIFTNILDDVEKNEGLWLDWYNAEKPEMTPFPLGYQEKCTPLQQMMLLKCFRVDRIMRSISKFIMHQMKSEEFVKAPVLDTQNIFAQSSNTSPIVCMISPGYDPADDILKLANRLDKRCKYISLGQGQDVKARDLIDKGISKGHWVLLQNCHLLVKWMKTVEKILEKMDGDKVHKEFRLWLTTEVTPEFPLGILQRSLKVVTEPPNSLPLNMKTTYSKITASDMEECQHEAFRPLVYVLTFFHAVIQERRKYGKIGWNVPYDFNHSDYKVSFSLMRTYLNKAKMFNDPVPWDSVKFLVGEAMYGGRVTDYFDRRVLTTYLDEYMGDFLFDTFQPFHFFKSDKVDYTLPPMYIDEKKTKFLNLLEYEEFIDENILLENTPEVFGLHANAEIGYLTNASMGICRDLISLQTGSGSMFAGSGGISREEYIGKVATDISNDIPDQFDREVLIMQIPNPNPIQVVLLQEVERWNKLVAKMKASLYDLKRALAGDIGMSADLEDLSISLFNGTLPNMWRAFAPDTRKNLAGWLDHFQRRYRQYLHWIKGGTDPIVMWLSGLHIPESYITAIVQVTCKRYKWALDRTTLFSRVTKFVDPNEIVAKPVDGCYVTGLYMEGASWDLERSCLAKQEPKVLVVELPILEIVPVENSKLKLQNTFRTPVYVTPDRRNAGGKGLVFEADLATQEHVSHWILQGVALYLNAK